MDFHRDLRAHFATVSEALGVGPCVPWTLSWNLDEWWANGDVGIHPCRLLSLQNSQVLQSAPTEPRQSSSALVFFSFSQSCPSFPAEMEPQGSQVGWQLCCAFRILFSKCCNPTLGWLGLARCSEFPPGQWSILLWNHIPVILELGLGFGPGSWAGAEGAEGCSVTESTELQCKVCNFFRKCLNLSVYP